MNFSDGIVWLAVAKWCASTASCRLYGLLMTRIHHSGAEQAVSLYVNCFLAGTNSSRNSLILCGCISVFLYFLYFCLCGCSHALTEERGERKTKAGDKKGVDKNNDNDNGSCKRLEQIGTTMASIATSIYKKEIL